MFTLRPAAAILLTCTFAAAARPDDVSWVGKTVLPRKAETKIGLPDMTGKIVSTSKAVFLQYDVIADQDGKLKVWQDGVQGFLNKDDYVLADDAVEYFTNKIKQNKLDSHAFGTRAWAWALKGDFVKSLKDHDQAIRITPRETIQWNNRGYTYYVKKDYDRAIKDYDMALRLDPKYVISYFNRGVAWSAKKEHDRAIKDYSTVIKLNPKHSWALARRGEAWNFKKEYDKAIKDCDEAIRLSPQFVLALGVRGNAYYGKQLYDRAVEDYDAALKIYRFDVASIGGRGRARAALKNYELAIADYRIAIRLDEKGSAAVQGYLAWLYATCPEDKYRDGTKALELARKANELSEGKDAAVLESLAAACAETGQFEEAVKWQGKALADRSNARPAGEEARQRLQLYKDRKPFRQE